ncbi:MAG: hypothetical protein IPF93_12840 [Saprospiraceae bacterium]|nr:hypothetical protein [Saprospiraceae bacterium]
MKYLVFLLILISACKPREESSSVAAQSLLLICMPTTVFMPQALVPMIMG